jgi:hypothetical protein
VVSPTAANRVKEDLLKGKKVSDRTFKVHLDGYNLMPFLKGDVTETPRHEFIYWTDGGSVAALRYNNWKITFLRQNAVGFKVWEAPFEELRWLEYEQRLLQRQRNVLVTAERPSVGQRLYEAAAQAGGEVLGQPMGRIAVGHFADFAVLDTARPALAHTADERLLDVAVFANHGNPVRDVFVSGRRVIHDGRHDQEEQIGDAYRAAVAHIRGA